MELAPVLKVQLEHIKQTMYTAFIDYQDGISVQVRQQLEGLLSEESFKFMIAQQVKVEFEKAVKSAIASYFEYGEGRRAIEEVIREACKPPVAKG